VCALPSITTLARPYIGPVAVTHRTVRPLKSKETAADREPLRRNDPPLACAFATPAHRSKRTCDADSSARPEPAWNVKPSTATQVAVDADAFLASTFTVIVCALLASPSNV
jgi:hypothetical protein